MRSREALSYSFNLLPTFLVIRIRGVGATCSYPMGEVQSRVNVSKEEVRSHPDCATRVLFCLHIVCGAFRFSSGFPAGFLLSFVPAFSAGRFCPLQ